MDRARLVGLVRLNASLGAGGRLLGRLEERFGSLEGALSAPAKALRGVRGVSERLAGEIAGGSQAAAEDEVARVEALGAEILGLGLPGYPDELADLFDPPLVLYVRGAIPPADDDPRLGIVGARRASAYGRRAAHDLARTLGGHGVTVVSGLARGIDAEAHRGALEAGGRTIAVLGTGLDRIYPAEHDRLADACAEAGALVSELPLGTPPRPMQFPRRNRIVAGLSRAVCVVEAAERSGSLITASWALEQGKDVLAVPHRLGDASGAGTLALLRDGALLVTGPDDLFLAAGVHPPRAEPEAAAPLKRELGVVLEAVPTDPRTLDEIVDALEQPSSRVFGALLELERLRLVRMGPGRTFSRWGPLETR